MLHPGAQDLLHCLDAMVEPAEHKVSMAGINGVRVCMCARACAGVRVSGLMRGACVSACVSACVRACVCACVCMRTCLYVRMCVHVGLHAYTSMCLQSMMCPCHTRSEHVCINTFCTTERIATACNTAG